MLPPAVDHVDFGLTVSPIVQHFRASAAGTTSTDRPHQGQGIYRTHPYHTYHVPGGAVLVWEPVLGLLGTAPNPNRVEHDQGGKRVLSRILLSRILYLCTMGP